MSRVTAQAAAIDTTDGRRRRGQDNRERIVTALMALIHEGNLSPSAEQVAAQADVGLRTVFRHFQDMDSLYREISKVIEAELQLIIARPMQAQDWRGRLMELIARRAEVFERIGPFKRAADALRHRSRFLGSDHDRLVGGLRALLTAVLPPQIVSDPLKMEALDLLMSFEAWSRLRQEQRLPPDRAQAVVEAAVARTIG
ncbi:MAG: TetR/AcrR family transcriptional regulator [Caulobacterales bacterium]|nr:TetR/AcrR family transcriptional regulator [Caulobacterales bacterium]